MDQMDNNNSNKRDLVSCYRYFPTSIYPEGKTYMCVAGRFYNECCSSYAIENVNGIKTLEGHSCSPPKPLNNEILGDFVTRTFNRYKNENNHDSDLLMVYSQLHPRHRVRPFSFKMKIRELELSRDNYIVPDNNDPYLSDWQVFRYRLLRTDADETKYYTCFHNKFIKCEASAVLNAEGVVNFMGNHIDPPRYEWTEPIGGIIQRAFRRRLAGNQIAETNDQFSDLFAAFRWIDFNYNDKAHFSQPVPFLLEITPVEIVRHNI